MGEFTNDEKIALLFKYSVVNTGSSSTALPYSGEPGGFRFPYIYNNYLNMEKIPTPVNCDKTDLTKEEFLQYLDFQSDQSLGEPEPDESESDEFNMVSNVFPYIRKIRRKLIFVPGTDGVRGNLGCFRHDDLKNSIPFNYYQTLYDYTVNGSNETGGVGDTVLQKNPAGGDYILDPALGQLTFYSEITLQNTNISVDEGQGPWVTFYKYDGRTADQGLINIKPEAPTKALTNGYLYINSTDNTLHRYDTTQGTGGEWISVGAGDSAINPAGQTFGQIMTQQPYKFTEDNFKTENFKYTSTTTGITLTWNYDNIIPTDSKDTLLAKELNKKSKTLPYIDRIVFEVRQGSSPEETEPDSTDDSGSNWTPLNTQEIDNNKCYLDYTTITFTKSLVDQKIGESQYFDIRIYGVNNSFDFPSIDDRYIICKGLTFTSPLPPTISSVEWIDRKVDENNQFTFKFKISKTSGETDQATIKSVTTNYSSTDTLSTWDDKSGSQSKEATLKPPVNANEDIQITIDGLKAGSQYQYNIVVKNQFDLESEPSSDQNFEHDQWLNIPDNNKVIATQAGISYTTTPNIFTGGDDFSPDNYIYVNTGTESRHTSYSVTQDNTQIQITNPSASKTDTDGFGKYLINESEQESEPEQEWLYRISCSSDGITSEAQPETITFKAWSARDQDPPSPEHTAGSIFFTSSSQTSDIWKNNDLNKGFRLKANFGLASISSESIIANIGPTSATPHTVTYTETRREKVGTLDGSAFTKNTEVKVYVDNLSGNPTIESEPDSTTVTQVVWCMGIPSVKEFSVNLARTYGNINSSFGFLPGNKKVGTVESIRKTDSTVTTSWNSTDFNVTTSDSTGIYNNNYTTNINYTTSIDAPTGGNETLTVTEKVYSLNTGDSGITRNPSSTISVNHYYDKNSFNTNWNSKLPDNIYEIHNITQLSDLSTLQVPAYARDSQTTKVKDHTLLYINGGFKSNAAVANGYPDVTQYQWNGTLESEPESWYSAGTQAYDIEGSYDPNGYKWIMFKVSGMNETSDEKSYKTAETGQDYFDLYGFLTNRDTINMDNTVVNHIKDYTSAGDQAIGFIRQTISNADKSSRICIGNLGRSYNSSQKWVDQLSSGVSYKNMVDGMPDQEIYASFFGCLYIHSDSDWGPQIDKINGADTMEIFIGIKNT